MASDDDKIDDVLTNIVLYGGYLLLAACSTRKLILRTTRNYNVLAIG
jgi:hypothetical protein